MELKEIGNNLYSVDEWIDGKYGKVGTPEREQFRREASAFCVGQIISDARKQERVTQSELARMIGTNKSYISKIEHGIVEPGVGMFLRIIDALGLKFDIVKPMM